MGGLEPPRVAPPDPKSGAYANFATFAGGRIGRIKVKYGIFGRETKGYATSPLYIPQDIRYDAY